MHNPGKARRVVKCARRVGQGIVGSEKLVEAKPDHIRHPAESGGA